MLIVAFVCFFALVVAWLFAAADAQKPAVETATPALAIGAGEQAALVS